MTELQHILSNRPLPSAAALTYDAVMAWALALDQALTTKRATLEALLTKENVTARSSVLIPIFNSLSFHGLTGEISFRKNRIKRLMSLQTCNQTLSRQVS
jgi:hypothetical protein